MRFHGFPYFYKENTQMRYIIFNLVLLFLSSSLAIADNGLVSMRSAHNVQKTADRLEEGLKAKGMRIFIRINHAKAAAKLEKKLRPTELILFGNPKIGTALMQCRQSIAIDLPQKALIWEDEGGQVWLSYNDPGYLAKRHTIEGCKQVLEKVAKALRHFATTAVAP